MNVAVLLRKLRTRQKSNPHLALDNPDKLCT